MLGKIKGRRRMEWQMLRWLSPIQLTFVWANSARWWRTGKHGVLQLWSTRVRHDWLYWVFIAAHGLFIVVHSFSLVLAWGLPLLWSSCCGTWALEDSGSVVVVCSLSCSTVCRILVSWSGWNLCSLHWKAVSQPLDNLTCPSYLYC